MTKEDLFIKSTVYKSNQRIPNQDQIKEFNYSEICNKE